VLRTIHHQIANRAGKSLLRAIFLLAAAAGLSARTSAQQLYRFDSMASAASAAIELHTIGSVRQKVLVTDFEETHGVTTQLGEALADNFADELRNHAKKFDVLDHRSVANGIADHHLPEGAFYSAGIEVCYAAKLDVTMIVKAEFEYAPDGLVFDLRIFPAKGDKGIFGDKIVIPLTPEMESLKSRPRIQIPDSFGDDKTVWAKDSNGSDQQVMPVPGTNGYSYPGCLYCPQATYSAEAVRAHAQGPVVLRVVIGAGGSAEKISVTRSLPCGLDEQAIDAVKSWRFKPATDSDGKPVAVLQTIEVTFHLY